MLVLVVAGCGSGGSSTSSTGESTGKNSSPSESEGSGSADVAAAEKIIAPYIGKPYPPFPVDEPLTEKPSADTKISQLQFETPYAALLASLVNEAAATAGVKVQTVKAGNTASKVQSAMQTILSQEPEVIILPGADPNLFSKQLEEAQEKGINVVSGGIENTEEFGIDAFMISNTQFEEAGKLEAAWTVAHHGPESSPVFYETPELSFNEIEVESFTAEMEKLCGECEVRTLPIAVTEIGNKAPSTVVSDLQSNPGTNQAVLAAPEIALGLPSAMKSAQLEVPIGPGFGGDPQTLEYIKNGEVEVVLGADAAVQAWTMFDEALRLAQGQELTAGEKKGWAPMQLLTQKDITFNPEHGWSSEPEFQKRFAKLWHAE
ncbi:MAG TPA: substrate-binding domain-containing protein [Solirubrobacterales bacterium]